MSFFNNVIIRFIAISAASVIIACPLFALNKILDKNILSILFVIVFFVMFNLIYYFSTNKQTNKLFLDKNEFRVSLHLKEILILIILQILLKLLFTVYDILFVKNIFVEYQTSVISIFNIIIIAPIIEEWVFRGVFLKSLLTKYSSKRAIVISSLFFAIIHIYPIQIIAAFVIGYYLASIYVKTKSIVNVVILHSIANLFGMISMSFFNNIFY